MNILRMRVIEGSIPMPEGLRSMHPALTDDNFEIICPYNKENFEKLIGIGRKAYQIGDLSKMEILAWAGGASNHDGARYLWSFRPDLYNFEQIPPSVYVFFDHAGTLTPVELDQQGKAYYNKFWLPLEFGISLSVYEEHLSHKPALDDQVKAAMQRGTEAQGENIRTFDHQDKKLRKEAEMIGEQR